MVYFCIGMLSAFELSVSFKYFRFSMNFKFRDLKKATKGTLLAQEEVKERDKLNITLIRKTSLPFVECGENGKKCLLNWFSNVKFEPTGNASIGGTIKYPRYCAGRHAKITTLSIAKSDMTTDQK